MKKLLFLLILLIPSVSLAVNCGPGTQLAWDYEQPLPANVDGFKLYANGIEIWQGTTLDATPDLGVTVETKDFYVTAYNVEPMESLPTNVRFPN